MKLIKRGDKVKNLIDNKVITVDHLETWGYNYDVYFCKELGEIPIAGRFITNLNQSIYRRPRLDEIKKKD